MAKASTTITFANGDQVTSTKLNQIISGFSLEADSVDGTTITLSSGSLSVGTLSAANYGALSVGTAAIAADAITGAKIADDAVDTEHIADDAIEEAQIADGAVAWLATKSADRAVQADMQSETAAHFVSPDVLKYHPGIAKAGGIVEFVTGNATVTGGYNVSGATDTGTGRQITLAVTMANTNYRVIATYMDNAAGNSLSVQNDSTTQFTIFGVEATGRKITFNVFGTLA